MQACRRLAPSDNKGVVSAVATAARLPRNTWREHAANAVDYSEYGRMSSSFTRIKKQPSPPTDRVVVVSVRTPYVKHLKVSVTGSKGRSPSNWDGWRFRFSTGALKFSAVADEGVCEYGMVCGAVR